MIDDQKGQSTGTPHRLIGYGAAMIGAAALVSVAFAIYLHARGSDEPAIPNPQSVTCSQFAGLTSAQQNRIAHELGKRADGQQLNAAMINDGYCGIVVGPNDPVAGATELGS